LLPLSALPQSFIPKDLEGWQSWVLQDRPFLRCPFFANTDGTLKENRVCALPGRLTLELTQSGGRFAQSWLTFSEGWIPLPGNLDNWPAELFTFRGTDRAAALRSVEDLLKLADTTGRPWRLRDLALSASRRSDARHDQVQVAVVAKDVDALISALRRALAGEHDPAAQHNRQHCRPSMIGLPRTFVRTRQTS